MYETVFLLSQAVLSNKPSAPALESNRSEAASEGIAGAGAGADMILLDDDNECKASDIDDVPLAALFSSPVADRH